MFKCFCESFIKSYARRNKIKKIFSLIYYLNLFIPKNSKEIIAFIDYEYVDGNYIPYRSDNVYILAQYIEAIDKSLNITFIPSNQFGGKSSFHLSLKKKLFFMMKRLTSKIIIYKQPPHLSTFFTKKQHLVCLGYFIPFKADYWDFTQWWVFYGHILSDNFNVKECSKYREAILTHFTYDLKQFERTNLTYITASKYASKVIARSHNLPIESFKVLGSPKSDKAVIKEISIKEMCQIKDKFKKVVLYTPTFRDKNIRKNIDNVNKEELTLFGYENEIEELEEFLVREEILIIVKLHKSFDFYRELEKLLMKDDKSYCKNCYFIDFELEAKYEVSIYDLFAQSDAMIADYSSISFDYLSYDKPIIYNIPDIEEYREYRGFSYEPIENMMPGERVKTMDEFKESLLNILNETDKYKEKRKEILSIVNEVSEGESIQNIYMYINKIIDKGSST